ncbi:IucA/IucC family C-terminal-domain containing protein [uncultured Paenibacillus sp.]|uniref:IucA/IucC family C-terminal-domain containing protein n=1 Tax=uncultured Paenibacillus sp. TaxID=227322 RepID=UPI0028D570C5|nr:IucA/IucC family C-terminal-domain containing protein [uncultured Paenibacillus sp.]
MNDAMLSSLKQEEWDYLTGQLRLTTIESLDRRHSISSRDLLDEQQCGVYLDRLASVYRSPSRKITASSFSKRYAFLLVSAGLYAMTMYKRGLDLAIDNCHVESLYRNDSWMPNLRLGNCTITQPESGNRYEWRDQMINNMFAGHMAKIWHSVSKAASISRSVLWENTAIYVYTLYEKRMAAEAEGQEKIRMQEDFEYLIGDAPAVLFGEKKNPLNEFYNPKCKLPASDSPVRIRKTCCFYYKISGNESYCPTCPIVNQFRKDTVSNSG